MLANSEIHPTPLEVKPRPGAKPNSRKLLVSVILRNMNILLIANYLPDQQQSMRRFAAVLESSLVELGHSVRVVRPKLVVGKAQQSGGGLGKWLGYLDKFVLFPRELRKSLPWADIVHICDHSNSLYIPLLKDRSHVVTCHDMLAIRSARGEISHQSTGWTGRIFQILIAHFLNQAQHVACVSHETQKDLLRICKGLENRTSVISNGLNYPYSPMPQEEASARLRHMNVPTQEPFMLHVGGNHWYKNRLGVLKIFSRIREEARDLKLITVGQEWSREMREFSGVNSLGECVIELPEISNEDLRALYSTAECLLFPSFREGFGWPLIEAQACACPVITSNRPPMNYIAGDAAIYIDPEDSEAAAATILKSFDTLGSRRGASLQNARRFESSSMVSKYLDLYERLAPTAPQATLSVV